MAFRFDLSSHRFAAVMVATLFISLRTGPAVLANVRLNGAAQSECSAQDPNPVVPHAEKKYDWTGKAVLKTVNGNLLPYYDFGVVEAANQGEAEKRARLAFESALAKRVEDDETKIEAVRARLNSLELKVSLSPFQNATLPVVNGQQFVQLFMSATCLSSQVMEHDNLISNYTKTISDFTLTATVEVDGGTTEIRSAISKMGTGDVAKPDSEKGWFANLIFWQGTLLLGESAKVAVVTLRQIRNIPGEPVEVVVVGKFSVSLRNMGQTLDNSFQPLENVTKYVNRGNGVTTCEMDGGMTKYRLTVGARSKEQLQARKDAAAKRTRERVAELQPRADEPVEMFNCEISQYKQDVFGGRVYRSKIAVECPMVVSNNVKAARAYIERTKLKNALLSRSLVDVKIVKNREEAEQHLRNLWNEKLKTRPFSGYRFLGEPNVDLSSVEKWSSSPPPEIR